MQVSGGGEEEARLNEPGEASGLPLAARTERRGEELLRYLIVEEEPVNLGVLSARQKEILELVVDGLSNAEIAGRLFLSESTVKQHLGAAYKLLGVSNRTEAANVIRRGD